LSFPKIIFSKNILKNQRDSSLSGFEMAIGTVAGAGISISPGNVKSEMEKTGTSFKPYGQIVFFLTEQL